MVISFSYALPAAGQTDTLNSEFAVVDTLINDFGLFTKEEPLAISLRFDVKEYVRKRPKEEYMEAVLTYYISDTDSINKEIRLKSRGEFRHGFCSFPPIMINLKNTEFENTDFKGIEKIKLVTHCNMGHQEDVLKEYLIYKLYNAMTDYSFKVRLLNINYIDSKDKRKTITAHAFLIEPVDLIETRTSSVEVENDKLSQRNMIPEVMDRTAIFNYMIGNTDWSVPGPHNCKVFVPKEITSTNLAYVVPYDFDYSGLVDASYAIPGGNLPIKSVRERYYTGICRSEEEFQNDLKEFIDLKEKFYSIINEFTYLHERTKKDMIRYLDEFYSDIDDNFSIVYDLLRTCKNL